MVNLALDLATTINRLTHPTREKPCVLDTAWQVGCGPEINYAPFYTWRMLISRTKFDILKLLSL